MKEFLHKLVKVCPSLPYMSLGIWLAWAYIAYSGTAWLSDTETNGANISTMYIVSTLTFGISLLASALGIPFSRKLLDRFFVVVGGGVLASLGCIVVILVGPYYLNDLLPDHAIQLLFYFGCMLSGLGTSIIGLKCGQLYGNLAPRKSILYASLSHIVLALIYFTIIGSPTWAPISGGPSFIGILSFTIMPLFASMVAALSFLEVDEKSETTDIIVPLPRPFWKLIIVTFVFSFVVVSMRSMIVELSPVDVTLENTRMLMILRILMAFAFAAAAIGVDAERFDFGKIYSVIMAAVVALIAFCPIVGVMHLGWSQVVTFLSTIFEFVLWCILAFVVYQRRISAVLVFGFGYGAFMLGSGFGWTVGVHFLPQVENSNNSFVVFIALAFVVLACAFILFSEKEFTRLFKTNEDDSLDDLLGDEVPVKIYDNSVVDKKGKFGQAIDDLATQYGLSKREKDVLRCLAMGYDSSATAKKLQISWNTVRTHTRNVYGKLNVHSKQALIDCVDKTVDHLL